MASPDSVSVSLSAYLISATFLFLVVYLVLVIKSYRRLKDFPGPWPARFTNLWLAKLLISGSVDTDLEAVFEKYGPIIRVGPNSLMTKDPDMIRKMNATRSPYTRAEKYKTFKFSAASDNVLSTLDEERHMYLRNKMTPGYAGKGNPYLEQQINNRIQDLMNLIDTKYKSVASNLRPLDLARITPYFTIDTLSDIAFNRPLGYLISDSDQHQYVQSVRQSAYMVLLLGTLPWLLSFFETAFIRKMFEPSPNDPTGLGRSMGIAKESIAERFGQDKKVKHDMIGSFINNGLTQEEIESELILQIIAGTDTTATALRITIFNILSQTKVYNALRSEIDTAGEKGRLTIPISTDAEAKELPYLQACIREGLRICPPVTAGLDRIVPAEGDTFAGKSIPGGTILGQNFYAVQRNKALFGEDANYYRPERWLEADAEQRLQMERAQELVFNVGRYMCMGKTIAHMELNKCILEMFRRYDWTRIHPENPFKTTDLGLKFHSDMWVRVSDRTKDGKD